MADTDVGLHQFAYLFECKGLCVMTMVMNVCVCVCAVLDD